MKNKEQSFEVSYKFVKQLFLGILLICVIYIAFFAKLNTLTSNITKTESVEKNSTKCIATESIEKVKKSVVKIIGENSSGTGFFINNEGFIITNYHVIQNESQVHVLTNNGVSFLAEIYNYDPRVDIALLKIASTETYPSAKWGEIETISAGTDLYAVGYPYSDVLKGGATVTKGSFSSLRKSDDGLMEFIQTDTSLNPGNSGGPLIDVCGNVIGINELVMGGADGLNFAISENTAKNYVDTLILGKKKEIQTIDVNTKSAYSPEETVGLFYTFISIRQFDKAFSLLSYKYQTSVDFEQWKNGYKSTLNVYVTDYHSVQSDEAGYEAVFASFISADLKGDQVVFKKFEGIWHLAQNENGVWQMDHGPINEIK